MAKNKKSLRAAISAVSKAIKAAGCKSTVNLSPAQKAAATRAFNRMTPGQKAAVTRARNKAAAAQMKVVKVKKSSISNFGPANDHRTLTGQTALQIARSNAAKKAAATRKRNAALAKAKNIQYIAAPKRTVAIKSKTFSKGTKTIYDCLVLDKSGSMTSVLNETLTGVNEYIDNIQTKTPKGVKAFVSLIQFSDRAETTFSNLAASSVTRLDRRSYVPSGLTALNDAVALAIKDLLAHLGARAASKSVDVTITVFTDGMENNSKDYPGYNNPQLAALTKEVQNKYGWTIAFVGAGSQGNVQAMAKGLNIAASNVAAYTAGGQGTTTAFANLTSARSMKSTLFAGGTKCNSGYFASAATSK